MNIYNAKISELEYELGFPCVCDIDVSTILINVEIKGLTNSNDIIELCLSLGCVSAKIVKAEII